MSIPFGIHDNAPNLHPGEDTMVAHAQPERVDYDSEQSYLMAVEAAGGPPAENATPAEAVVTDAWVMVPRDATSDMTADAVRHALSVSISSEYPWPQYMADLYKIMLAAAPALTASPPRDMEIQVKPLEWVDNGRIISEADNFSYFSECQSLLGKYRIGYLPTGWRTRFNGQIIASDLASPDAAKAAAQADFNARILSALHQGG